MTSIVIETTPVEVCISTLNGPKTFAVSDPDYFVGLVVALYGLWLENYPKARKDFCVETRVGDGPKMIYKFGPDESSHTPFCFDGVWYSFETNERSQNRSRWVPTASLKILIRIMLVNMGFKPIF